MEQMSFTHKITYSRKYNIDSSSTRHIPELVSFHSCKLCFEEVDIHME